MNFKVTLSLVCVACALVLSASANSAENGTKFMYSLSIVSAAIQLLCVLLISYVRML